MSIDNFIFCFEKKKTSHGTLDFKVKHQMRLTKTKIHSGKQGRKGGYSRGKEAYLACVSPPPLRPSPSRTAPDHLSPHSSIIIHTFIGTSILSRSLPLSLRPSCLLADPNVMHPAASDLLLIGIVCQSPRHTTTLNMIFSVVYTKY